MNNTDELLTTAEVAQLTGWSVTSINRWATNGDLPVERKLPGPRGTNLFRRSVVEERVRPHTPRSGVIRGAQVAS